MNGTIQNRDSFLQTIAQRLGRNPRKEGVERPSWSFHPQEKTLAGYSSDELVDAFIKQCKNVHVDVYRTTSKSLKNTLKEAIAFYGGGPIVTWDDHRFEAFGLMPFLLEELPNEGTDVHIWDPELGKENIQIAERANIGITFSDYTLAESGTVVLLNGGGKGRAVSLLPTTYISIIPKSTILPRMTQAARKFHQMVEKGETISSCINFITGPSNSADIEMNLVVGVHGPIKTAYLIIEDC
ncbi:MAG: lactate utilization protein C [Bacillaceae bacterium]|jgi:Uncharacterized conserved protein|uniref:Lactate utilization protein C n=2 Tax=Aeribacillus TaxID=1055323 RepID=A0A165WEA8_9BACI|nr:MULTISPECIES: lactate utilization protein C [Aeribacillus]REJ19408.1 MAG: lactate utilization protein C [Bacillaceae bacterium]ASS90785.1 lactate utilization protein C [Aeribacillus pallidus]KZN94913.1 lactate utilization protein C [Aeribacillus pallidus]MDR9796194.1 lactate utilization protein C [Aeribacillus pallidus]MED1440795.1 lactate utilization protein C [Aeribacillus composti]